MLRVIKSPDNEKSREVRIELEEAGMIAPGAIHRLAPHSSGQHAG